MIFTAVQGQVDDQHRLIAIVPETVPPGPMTVWFSPVPEDDAGTVWMNGISQQWADDLSDPQQDIYTLADGVAVDPA